MKKLSNILEEIVKEIVGKAQIKETNIITEYTTRFMKKLSKFKEKKYDPKSRVWKIIVKAQETTLKKILTVILPRKF